MSDGGVSKISAQRNLRVAVWLEVGCFYARFALQMSHLY